MANSITVSNLSKRFIIGQAGPSTALREAMVRLAKRAIGRQHDEKVAIWALKDVSFEVKPGEVLGIIGANGAGKSTLLKILSRITYPTTGSMKVDGRIASLLEVGTGFHEELTGRENVFLNGSILGMTKAEIKAHFDEIVEFSGVGAFIDTPLKRYSSGMRLRLGFAVAAHLEPDILLIDEVLAVGDAGFQKKCMQAVKELRSGGRTVLFVSHDMAAVENLCPRAIWINDGKVHMDGPAIEVITSYISSFAGDRKEGHDLRNVPQRRGNGDIRFNRIEFLDAAGQPKPLVRAGDGLVMRMHFDAAKSVRNPLFGIEVFTELGTLVSDLSTWGSGLEVPMVHKGPGYVDLAIDFLNLMPGRYYFSLWAGAMGPVFFDFLDHCDWFAVEASDYFQSGKGLDSRLGIVFLPCKWACTSSQADALPLVTMDHKEGSHADRIR